MKILYLTPPMTTLKLKLNYRIITMENHMKTSSVEFIIKDIQKKTLGNW